MSLLNESTQKKVKSLCKSTCCNYINGGCILFENKCAYEMPYGKNASCEWFETSVLPNDKELLHAYFTQQGNYYTEEDDKTLGKYSRTCTACNERFKTDSKSKRTCSDRCSKDLRKARNNRYYRKRQSTKADNEGLF